MGQAAVRHTSDVGTYIWLALRCHKKRALDSTTFTSVRHDLQTLVLGNDDALHNETEFFGRRELNSGNRFPSAIKS